LRDKHPWIRQIVLPIVTALIWGSAFLFQSVAAGQISPFTFNASRSLMGCLTLFILLLFRKKYSGEPLLGKNRRKALWGGLLCGLDLTLATNLQQIGLITTGPGKAGFITAMYIVLVPVLGLFLRRKTGGIVWISMVISAVGLYLLCVSGEFSITGGDILLILCSLIYAVHILLVDYFVAYVDGFVLSFCQFAVCTLFSTVGMLIFEEPSLKLLIPALPSILYVGVFSSGVAYTLQILSQRSASPAMVSLLFSLESVFATVFGAIFLHERMSLREYAGCLLVLIAVVLPQILSRRMEKRINAAD